MRNLTLVIFSVIGCSVFALQENPRPIKAQDISDEILSIDIRVKEKEVCIGDRLKIVAKIRSQSSEDVVIDRNKLWYTLSFSTLHIDADKASGTTQTTINEPGPGYEPDFVRIAPNSRIHAETSITIEGDDFFKADENYDFEITYGQFQVAEFAGISVWRGSLGSNKVTFQIRNCKPKARRN